MTLGEARVCRVLNSIANSDPNRVERFQCSWCSAITSLENELTVLYKHCTSDLSDQTVC